MFGFLKDKLKGALSKLTKEVEKDAVVEKKETIVEKKIDEKKPEKRPEEKKEQARPKVVEKPKVEERKPQPKIEEKRESQSKAPEVQKIEEPKKKGFFQRIFGKRDEEEDIIEKKEELLERAEKIMIEPEVVKEKKDQKAKVEPKIVEKKPVKTEQKFSPKTVPKAEPKIDVKIAPKPEERTSNKTISKTEQKIEHRTEYIKPDIKIEPVIQTIKQEPVAPTLHKAEPVVHKEEIATQVIHKVETPVKKPEHIITKIEKPHHQVVEEERASKTIEHKEEEEHKGFFSKITETFTKIQMSEEKFEELFWDLEVVLLENNVAVEVIDKIKRDLKKELMAGKISRKGVDELIISTLRQSITELFDVEKIDLVDNIKAKRKKGTEPYIIAIIGVNGSGKTTSIAKLTYKLQKEGLQVVLAASDTFRAAAIQQLEEHATRLNVKMVKHDYNSDPAAVAFDAIKYAQAKNADVVIIDTAGRLHSNTNLMRELEKVIRVCKPDIKIFVGESITGNDCVEQAKEFDKAVGIDAIILAKADVDDKGGAAISVSYILQRPILYLGTGQNYEDLKEFDPKVILESLEL